jgi:hypothetical protein
MPRKETAAQKKTRIGMLLADYHARNAELAKLNAIVKGMKTQIRAEVEPGTYGDMVFGFGTPREILDQPAARKRLQDNGIEIPMTTTEPPLVVTPKVK